ncbi:hypothetical protein BJ322DRAFT_1025421 [Thelephora terrestris]|uniref:Uncharacterized protein n=1 Tax=Thelephora terrestris TaxID=56493 RepID=A0A9P6H414_9AGAM|nr:hypothetical protein BJ322DRAFT_1025421 [Thelephora terrestris]
MGLDDMECMGGIVELAKTQHALERPFEHVELRMSSFPVGMKEDLGRQTPEDQSTVLLSTLDLFNARKVPGLINFFSDSTSIQPSTSPTQNLKAENPSNTVSCASGDGGDFMGTGNPLPNFGSTRNSHTLSSARIFRNQFALDCCILHSIKKHVA